MKYHLHKLFGRLFNEPIIPIDKTIGYSLVRSERSLTEYGKNVQVYPPFFMHRVSVGDYSYIAYNAHINNTDIGKFCSIGPNCCCGLGVHPTHGISTSPMFYSTAKQNGVTMCSKNDHPETKHIIIGNDVFIGANVTILDGVTIGDGAVIGAGAVVSKDIPPYAVAVGSPIQVIRFRFSPEQITSLLRIKWWNWSDSDLQNVASLFDDIDGFIKRFDK